VGKKESERERERMFVNCDAKLLTYRVSYALSKNKEFM